MEINPGLDEIVLFELPANRAARRLHAELSPHRLAWLQGEDGISVVGVLLNPDVGDFAQLLRSVQAWLDRARLAAIRFEVDGRTYVLEPRRPALAVG